MSSFAKGFGGCLGVFGAILCVCVGGCVFISFIIRDSPGEPDQNQELIAKPVKHVAHNPGQKIVAKPSLPSHPKWIVETTKDELTDEPIVHSTLQSTNTVNLAFPYDGEQRGTLSLIEQAGQLSVIFQIQKGQLFPETVVSETASTNIRIDDKVFRSLVRGSSESTLCFLADEGLPELIRKGKEMRIEVELYQEANQVFVFDLTSGR